MPGLSVILFALLASAVALSALAVVFTTNIVRAAVWLLFTLAGMSGLYFLLAAEFVASVQLLVYVGGILVLLVFGVMLTAQGPLATLRTPLRDRLLAAVVGGAILLALLNAIWQVPEWQDSPYVATPTPTHIGLALLGDPAATVPAEMTGYPATELPPARIPVGYLLPFEILSVHLLVVLIGAAYLARAKRRVPPAGDKP